MRVFQGLLANRHGNGHGSGHGMDNRNVHPFRMLLGGDSSWGSLPRGSMLSNSDKSPSRE